MNTRHLALNFPDMILRANDLKTLAPESRITLPDGHSRKDEPARILSCGISRMIQVRIFA